MIPKSTEILIDGFDLEQEPSLVHKAWLDEEVRIYDRTDGLEAIKQAIYMILMTERYDYIIYSWDYGVELKDLFGMPISYVCPEIERRVTEALMMDDRILSVHGFTFEFPKRGVVHTTFKVNSIFGEIEIDKEVIY